MKTCPQCKMRYPNEAVYCFLDGADLVPLADVRIGTILVGRYVLEEVIGEGGMATVYRAKHRFVDRSCAIKIMNPLLATDDVVRERFRREAKNASKLAHPNIIEIYDQGDTDDGTAYIAMELLDGVTLAEIISKGPIPAARAVPIMAQLARGIARAHDLEVIHRDLKPENVMIVRQKDGTELAKILDFGIARSRTDSRLTGAGELFGTPQYLAPERIERGETGPSVDLYAIGVIFWEMLTGKLPFEASDIAAFFVKHVEEQAASTRSIVPSVPEALDALVLSLLAKDPKARPVDAHRVQKDLRAIAEREGYFIPPEEEENSKVAPTLVLPSSRNVPWSRRVEMVERVLSRAYGPRPPPPLVDQLGQLRSLVKRMDDVAQASMNEQTRLGALDTKGREGRTRLGFAVDALGVDASKARDDVRIARAMATLATNDKNEVVDRYKAAHKEIIAWEGRSGFLEPYVDLADAYRAAASAVDAWRAARDEERRALEAQETHQRTLSDLEFQIRELRAALLAHEQSIDQELRACEAKILEQDRATDMLAEQAEALVRRFCDPLRGRPDLEHEIGPLLRDLGKDAAA